MRGCTLDDACKCAIGYLSMNMKASMHRRRWAAKQAFAALALVVGLIVPAAPGLTTDAGAETLATAWLAAKGWEFGINQPGPRLVLLATSTVSVPASSPLYVHAREEAFESAFMDARRKAVEALSAEVSGRVAAREDLTEVIGDPELARTLTGIASDEAFRGSREFEDAIEVAARASIAGLYAAQTFEHVDESGRSEIAIVATVSPGSAKAAVAEPGGTSDGTLAAGWFASLDDASLARTFGVRFAPIAGGSIRAVAFGQAVRGALPLQHDLAITKATEIARGHLLRLRAESIESRVLSDSLSRL